MLQRLDVRLQCEACVRIALKATSTLVGYQPRQFLLSVCHTDVPEIARLTAIAANRQSGTMPMPGARWHIRGTDTKKGD